VLPDDPTSPVALDLPEARTEDVLRLSFVTRVGPSGDRGWDWALWRDVRIVVGEEEQGFVPLRSAVSVRNHHAPNDQSAPPT
jgi:hypothetical protein